MLPGGNYRLNDPVYLRGQDHNTPKEYFKSVVSLIESRHHQTPITIIDLGCAAGRFLHYAKSQLQLSRFVGIDMADVALSQARNAMPDGEWVQGSILNTNPSYTNVFDIATCLGTIAVFDDLEAVLTSLLRVIKPGGYGYIYDLVNDEPIDLLMRYRRVDPHEESPWESGLNVQSQLTYEKVLRRLGAALCQAVSFKLPFEIPRTTDAMRAWTIQTAEDPHQLVVGTGQMLKFKILEVRKS